MEVHTWHAKEHEEGGERHEATRMSNKLAQNGSTRRVRARMNRKTDANAEPPKEPAKAL